MTIVEYASMTCPHCQSFHVNTFAAFREKYVETGKVRFIMREWTLLFRKLAEAPDPAVESTLEASIRVGRNLAYLYWIGIASVCLIGAAKSF